MNTLDGFCFIGCYFVHACKDNDMLWAVDKSGDAVSVPVYIYKFTVFGDGIAAHEIVITG